MKTRKERDEKKFLSTDINDDISLSCITSISRRRKLAKRYNGNGKNGKSDEKMTWPPNQQNMIYYTLELWDTKEWIIY
jgi:hypothetical protein